MKQKRGFTKPAWTILVLLVLTTYSAWAIFRPLPALQPTNKSTISAPASKPELAWLNKGQSAVAILNTDILETYGTQKPVPMASTAKVITALMLLKEKPLDKGEQGPVYTITQADVDIYNRYVAQDGSVLPVKVGMQLTQYQMLQAMMLPSANNIADALAISTYGSLAEYSKSANAYLKTQGIKNTKVGSDASGLAPDSITTAEDLVKIGRLAMKHVVLSEVVGQSSVTTIPNNPLVRNVNTLLGKDGIVGIKTGTSTEAGGVFLGASKKTINSKELTIITAVVGASGRPEALQSSQTLIRSAQNNFQTIVVAKKGQVVGTYTAPWGETRQAVLNNDLSISRWKGEQTRPTLKLEPVTSDQKQAGTITFDRTSVQDESSYPVSLDKSFSSPSVWWRFTHPF